ncbi:uncharacterized protein LOC6560808 isoform X3 [Drosophila grimshawi]|uniref:GH19971 n=1 Tax=Drosophila grimshawi TaxID=7222 RepID=B4J8D8_DROGR|nr:uncharacterized protein LOC6560808 isoform X3 [Drosophila grimshawi]EDW02297.1 GH19971 [Drosophila grimshawi]
MHMEFWFCGILIGIAVALILRECYLFVRIKLAQWNLRVLLRREMMLHMALEDRQNNVEQGRDHRSFNDIFFIEPNSPEAARIREQLEKDDKDLPSYDDVIRMCNLTTPTAAAAPATPTPTMESTSICLAALPAPPYSEVDPHLHLAENSLAVSSLEQTPSTSRAHTTSTTMV